MKTNIAKSTGELVALAGLALTAGCITTSQYDGRNNSSSLHLSERGIAISQKDAGGRTEFSWIDGVLRVLKEDNNSKVSMQFGGKESYKPRKSFFDRHGSYKPPVKKPKYY